MASGDVEVLKGGVEASLKDLGKSIERAVDLAYALYGLDILGTDVSGYLKRFQDIVERNVRVWVSLSFDIPRIDPDAITLLYKLYSKYGFSFAERVRSIVDDVKTFQLPDGRIIMGDHFGLTRLIIALEGEESEAAKLAIKHAGKLLNKVSDVSADLANALLTMVATPNLSRRFRKQIEGLIEKLVKRQLPNGSWANEVFLTCRAVRGIAASRLLIYKDNAEAGMRWLQGRRKMGGLDPKDLGYLIATISEVRIGAYEVKFPTIIRDIDELHEFVSALILMSSKKVLLLNLASDDVFKAVKKGVERGVTIRVLLGPNMSSYLKPYGEIGINVQKTNIKGVSLAIIDDEMVVIASQLGDGKVLGLAIKAPDLTDQLIAGLF